MSGHVLLQVYEYGVISFGLLYLMNNKIRRDVWTLIRREHGNTQVNISLAIGMLAWPIVLIALFMSGKDD